MNIATSPPQLAAAQKLLVAHDTEFTSLLNGEVDGVQLVPLKVKSVPPGPPATQNVAEVQDTDSTLSSELVISPGVLHERPLNVTKSAPAKSGANPAAKQNVVVGHDTVSRLMPGDTVIVDPQEPFL
ncbi:MAG: hypothetical protein ACLP8S_04195 [Solirubrobacteraceae bacterium]